VVPPRVRLIAQSKSVIAHAIDAIAKSTNATTDHAGKESATAVLTPWS